MAAYVYPGFRSLSCSEANLKPFLQAINEELRGRRVKERKVGCKERSKEENYTMKEENGNEEERDVIKEDKMERKEVLNGIKMRGKKKA